MAHDVLRRPADLRLRDFHGIYTVAPQMAELFVTLQRVARASCTVLLGGETGTGKELVARAIHAESPRRKAPFQAVNCATFSPTLLESELFGHVRGAFTGAVRDRAGLFALADGGTLFLDEVAEIPLELQGKLLRVMQEKPFVPVGATRPGTVVVGEETILDVQDLTPELRGDSLPDSSTQSLGEAERERILTALTRHNGRRAAAAADLGISRSTLWRKLYAYRLR